VNNFNQVFEMKAWRQSARRAALRRVLLLYLPISLACGAGLALTACKTAQAPATSSAGTGGTQTSTFTTPPFSTREPERYQAVRVTSVTETSSTESSPGSETYQVLIARDGEKRREEYSAGEIGQFVRLELPAGQFLVLPSSRIYADLTSPSDKTDPDSRSPDWPGVPELSPDQLLNEANARTIYEDLGRETVAGRPTTKYRVVMLNGGEMQNETVIWIDEALGMPLKSESTSKSGNHLSKVTSELRDLSLEVDQRLFAWPSDYKKVEPQTVLGMLRKQGKPVAPKQ
jgi:outer membrane lipoprotein-sorting protein